MLEEGQGSLLDAEVDALVNPVNTQGVMGRGLALLFKQRFPEVFATYRDECRKGRVRVGQMFVAAPARAPPRFIIHFPTKSSWRYPSKLEYITSGLDDLITRVRSLGIRSVAVPALGCGTGGLSWAVVRPHIEAAFAPLPDVRVLLFSPQ